VDDKTFHELPFIIVHGYSARRCRLILLILQLRWNADGLAGFEAVTSTGALAVDADLAGPQQLFQRPVSERRVMTFEPPVEAQACLVFFHARGFTHAAIRTSQRPANKAATESTTEPII
jgi:hypothetical protein